MDHAGTKTKKWILPLGALCCGLLLAEVVAMVATKYLDSKGVFYKVPATGTYADDLEQRDPELGWPSKRHLAERYDASGSRPIPSFPQPGGQCVSLYGDSFTWSDQVGDEDAWSNQLSQMLGCRVANFGVSGYGTDQIYLRYRKNTADNAPVVVMNHFSGDIRRNVNRMRNLLTESAQDRLYLKPRFVLEGDTLVLLPLPTPSQAELADFVAHPEKHLRSEYFLPDTGRGLPRAGFPFMGSLYRAIASDRLRNMLTREAIWAEFYDPGHDSGALALTTAIITEFTDLVAARGRIAVVTLIPNARDLREFRTKGHWNYDSLHAALPPGTRVLDLGPFLLRQLGDRDICDIAAESCEGHYNAEGYRMIARGVYEYLQAQGLRPAAQQLPPAS